MPKRMEDVESESIKAEGGARHCSMKIIASQRASTFTFTFHGKNRAFSSKQIIYARREDSQFHYSLNFYLFILELHNSLLLKVANM